MVGTDHHWSAWHGCRGWHYPPDVGCSGGHGRRRGGPGQGGFGRGGPGGFGRWGGRGRVFGPGDLRLVLLALIDEQPRHGYELIKEIEQRFDGGYSPSPGSVYPTLTLLEELGYLRATASEGAKRLFEITDEGRTFLAENRTAVDGVMDRMELAARAMTGRVAPDAIYQAMHTLRTALRFHRGWTPTETERVRRILERAAQQISAPEDDQSSGS